MINIAAVKTDINNSELIKYPETNATGLAQQIALSSANYHVPEVEGDIALSSAPLLIFTSHLLLEMIFPQAS